MRLLVIMLFCFNIALNWAQAAFCSEIGEEKPALTAEPYPFHRLVTLGAIRAYQVALSPTKGSRCPMHPHCSLYGYQAFSTHDPATAFVLTADRLHRCGHDLENYQLVEVDGLFKFADPVPGVAVDTTAQLAEWSAIDSNALVENPRHTMPAEWTSDAADAADAKLFHFAQTLESAKDYDRAITEYRRLMFYYPDSPYRPKALRAILDCYLKSERYLAAANWGLELIEIAKADSRLDINELKHIVGLCYFYVKNYALSRKMLLEVVDDSAVDALLKDQSLCLIGLGYAHEYNWPSAQQYFSMISADSALYTVAQNAYQVAAEGQNLPLRNPVLAAGLGLVPGLGYLYAGFPQTALSSALANGLFIWGTYEAFKYDNAGLGAILGIFSIGWYAGNVYGSAVSAERKNLVLRTNLINRLDISFQF